MSIKPWYADVPWFIWVLGPLFVVFTIWRFWAIAECGTRTCPDGKVPLTVSAKCVCLEPAP